VAIDIAAKSIHLVTPDGAVIEGSDALQGTWTVEQYLRLTDHTHRLLEYSDGELELLPMPTVKHQAISKFLLFILSAFVDPRGGTVFYSPLRLLIREGKFREPDLMLLLDANDPRRDNRYWRGADLVIEVVSEDDPERDTVAKRADYAEGGIPEDWIVNPAEGTVTVLSLVAERGEYPEHGVFWRGQTATSHLLPDFGVQVSAIFDAH